MQPLDYAGLAAALSIRVRSSSAAVIMERGALIKAMTAIDDVEQTWRATLARTRRRRDDGLFYAVIEEMLEVDVLFRTWAAFVGFSIDTGKQPLRPQHAAALLTRMLLQQRRRLLLAIIGSDLDSESLQELDRHRRACERWGDILLSVFPATSSVRALQFSHANSRENADLWPNAELCAARTADPVVVTALKSALPPLDLSGSGNLEAYSQFSAAARFALEYDRRRLVIPIRSGV